MGSETQQLTTVERTLPRNIPLFKVHMPESVAEPLMETLRSLGEAPYLAEPPTGYEETSAQWASSGAMLTRMNFATSYVTGELRGVRPDGNRLLAEARERGRDPLAGLMDVLLPGTDTAELMAIIQQELRTNPPESQRESRVRTLGLILGSPEFQSH